MRCESTQITVYLPENDVVWVVFKVECRELSCDEIRSEVVVFPG